MKQKGREIEAFGGLMDTLIKGNAKIQTHYAYVTEVDWEAKTATVKGLLDDLEFYDVRLGLGALYVKPIVGSKCLIGLILNNDAQTFLIDAEELEEFNWTTGQSNMVIKPEGFVIKKANENLKAVLNDFITEVSKIIVIQGVTINVAALTAIKQRLNTILTD